MSSQQVVGCCCGCFYRIPLCACENDRCCCGGELPPNPCDYYIACGIMDPFFDANPGLGDHLVFGFFDPCAPDGECCYEIVRGQNQVTSVPPEGIELSEVPPPATWYLPPFDDCAFCCPTVCCDACCLEPGLHPACCFNPLVDLLTVSITRGAFTITENCCVGGAVISCASLDAFTPYAMAGCHLWIPIAGDTCTYSFVGLDCAPPGWFTSEDHTCTNLCTSVGKCADFKPCFGFCAIDCVAEAVDQPDLCFGFGFDVTCEVVKIYNCGAPDPCICQEIVLKVRIASLSRSCLNFPSGCCDQPCTCTEV